MGSVEQEEEMGLVEQVKGRMVDRFVEGATSLVERTEGVAAERRGLAQEDSAGPVEGAGVQGVAGEG
jgi:hypothetical protein